MRRELCKAFKIKNNRNNTKKKDLTQPTTINLEAMQSKELTKAEQKATALAHQEKSMIQKKMKV
jgi:hypothetical protein